jgi:general L-amino acid transport system substrate-binding protein
LLAAGALLAAPAHAGKTLDAIKARGQVICGVNTGLAGFAAADSQGNWSGLDVDVCKALAAATLGDAEQGQVCAAERAAALHRAAVRRDRRAVAQHHLDADARRVAGPALHRRHLLRRPGLHGHRTKTKIKSAKQLKGATVCVQSAPPPRRT